jgi:hypothetical protein
VQLLFNATGITPGLFVDLAEGSMHNLPDESHLDDDQGAQWETEAGDEGYGEEATGNPFGSSAAYAEATGYPFDQYLPPDEPTSPRPAETAPVRGIPSPDDLEAFFELVKAKAKARFPDVPQGAELNISVEF